jgi:16S rRNA (guanine966-N2)-methyltransferase
VPGAGRVSGGAARGLRLIGAGSATRPLSDRVKQSLFGGLADRLAGARVLDLFAGSGAAGIEALSRGATSSDFVERDERAVAAIRANLRSTGLAERGRVHQADVGRYLAGGSGERGPFDLVVLDPPYGDPAMLAALELLGGGSLLSPEAIVVAKHFWRDAPPEEVGVLRRRRVRRFGESALTFYEVGGPGHPVDDEAGQAP